MNKDKIIQADSEVIMHVDIKLMDGSVADSTRTSHKPARIVMGDGSLSAGFEQQLMGLQAGEKKAFNLAPDDAYGMPNPANFHKVPRDQFPATLDLENGLIIEFERMGGEPVPGVIRSFDDETATVDFNHPLAGQELYIRVEIVEVN